MENRDLFKIIAEQALYEMGEGGIPLSEFDKEMGKLGFTKRQGAGTEVIYFIPEYGSESNVIVDTENGNQEVDRDTLDTVVGTLKKIGWFDNPSNANKTPFNVSNIKNDTSSTGKSGQATGAESSMSMEPQNQIVPEKLFKSPMNYTGGKYKLLNQILPLFPKVIEGNFIDLFCGGCDVAVNAICKGRVIANDIDSNVIGIYQEMKKLTNEELINYIEKRISEYNLTIDNQEGYNKFRDDYNKTKNPLDLFILICFSFNHQIRFNKYGQFNMPFGKNRSYFNSAIKNNLINFHKALIGSGITFTNNNFLDLKIDKLSSSDFVYADPPYLITCATYNEQGGWNETLERRLYGLLDKLNTKGIKFALSNVISNKGGVNDILLNWSKKYNVHHLNKTYSNCSYHAKDRDKTTTDEVLVTNY